MFEKNTRFRVKKLLEREFGNFQLSQQILKEGSVNLRHPPINLNSSTDERNMTRKTRSRQLRIHSAFQPGYCAVCHIPYNSLEDHIQSKKHLKLIGDDGSYISLKGFDDQDSLLSLDGIDEQNSIDVKNCDLSPYSTRNKMPKTRAASLCDRNTKDSPMSPVGSDSGHHLRSRKNINYMTPPLDEDSLTEKPEVVKEYRELRSSTRLLAKLTDQMSENDQVWNSGRPKRSCNRSKISADERLVVDNKSYYKMEVLASKLRSGDNPSFLLNNRNEGKHHTPYNNHNDDDKNLFAKIRKVRNSELAQLNSEAENFLFPKKDDSSEEDDEDDDDNDENSSIDDRNDSKIDNHHHHNENFNNKKIKMEDDESMHSTCSENNRKKRKRRTHAEVFITDNQKYYKFETPGSRLRYQGSYLSSPVDWKTKNNGDLLVDNDSKLQTNGGVSSDKDEEFPLNEFNFSFEFVPNKEAWYKTFKRKDTGDEKYVVFDDENFWDPMILPYQLQYIPPLDPKTCISAYNNIKKCLMEPFSSASTSVGCSTPDPNASNTSSSIEDTHDEDSKASATLTEASSASTIDELKPVVVKKRPGRKPGKVAIQRPGRNPRKSPRQHASTLAILSSLIQQRTYKRKPGPKPRSHYQQLLPTIAEEPRKSPKQQKKDYLQIARVLDMEIENALEENLDMNIEVDPNDGIDFRSKIDILDVLNVYDRAKASPKATCRRLFGAKPGRKPGKKKKRKNLTGWPNRNNRRVRKKEEDPDDSTLDSMSITADSDDNEDACEETMTTTDNSIKKVSSSTNQQLQQNVKLNNSENNNKNDQSSLENECDLNDGGEKRDKSNNSCSSSTANGDQSVLTNNVESVNLQYQPYVRVQKLDKILDSSSESSTVPSVKRNTPPKRTNRGQRRMPASPKSPRMLRRPRGRWYRER